MKTLEQQVQEQRNLNHEIETVLENNTSVVRKIIGDFEREGMIEEKIKSPDGFIQELIYEQNRTWHLLNLLKENNSKLSEYTSSEMKLEARIENVKGNSNYTFEVASRH